MYNPKILSSTAEKSEREVLTTTACTLLWYSKFNSTLACSDRSLSVSRQCSCMSVCLRMFDGSSVCVYVYTSKWHGEKDEPPKQCKWSVWSGQMHELLIDVTMVFKSFYTVEGKKLTSKRISNCQRDCTRTNKAGMQTESKQRAESDMT